jgi:hypothetical protein
VLVLNNCVGSELSGMISEYAVILSEVKIPGKKVGFD